MTAVGKYTENKPTAINARLIPNPEQNNKNRKTMVQNNELTIIQLHTFNKTRKKAY